MIKTDHIQVYGFEAAVRGLRNPYDSWEKSDSGYLYVTDDSSETEYCIGEADLGLMQRLYKAGTEHRKFMRQIMVSLDIKEAPLYWWKQFDTYRIGVTSNSCSTMHTIMKHEFTVDDFSADSVLPEEMDMILTLLNNRRNHYLETENKVIKAEMWRGLIQLLPESYNQTRTVTMNYEVVATICRQRKGHKLTEWNDLIEQFMDNLPYLRLIMGE